MSLQLGVFFKGKFTKIAEKKRLMKHSLSGAAVEVRLLNDDADLFLENSNEENNDEMEEMNVFSNNNQQQRRQQQAGRDSSSLKYQQQRQQQYRQLKKLCKESAIRFSPIPFAVVMIFSVCMSGISDTLVLLLSMLLKEKNGATAANVVLGLFCPLFLMGMIIWILIVLFKELGYHSSFPQQQKFDNNKNIFFRPFLLFPSAIYFVNQNQENNQNKSNGFLFFFSPSSILKTNAARSLFYGDLRWDAPNTGILSFTDPDDIDSDFVLPPGIFAMLRSILFADRGIVADRRIKSKKDQKTTNTNNNSQNHHRKRGNSGGRRSRGNSWSNNNEENEQQEENNNTLPVSFAENISPFSSIIDVVASFCVTILNSIGKADPTTCGTVLPIALVLSALQSLFLIHLRPEIVPRKRWLGLISSVLIVFQVVVTVFYLVSGSQSDNVQNAAVSENGAAINDPKEADNTKLSLVILVQVLATIAQIILALLTLLLNFTFFVLRILVGARVVSQRAMRWMLKQKLFDIDTLLFPTSSPSSNPTSPTTLSPPTSTSNFLHHQQEMVTMMKPQRHAITSFKKQQHVDATNNTATSSSSGGDQQQQNQNHNKPSSPSGSRKGSPIKSTAISSPQVVTNRKRGDSHNSNNSNKPQRSRGNSFAKNIEKIKQDALL